MRLHSLEIHGFRRIRSARVMFGDATFLIGPNNSSKSSVLKALEVLLSANKRLPESNYLSEVDVETGETKVALDKVILLAEFRNLPNEARNWRGFKGRILGYEVPPGSDETGLSVQYPKTYPLGKDVIIEIRSKKRTRKPEFESCKTPQELIDSGIDNELVSELFGDLSKKLTAKETPLLEAIDEMWDVGTEEEWFENPGGIAGNVLSKLPRFLLIPAESSAEEITDERKGTLTKTLTELFEDVRDASENYKEAQKYLDKLAAELDPSDATSEFGKMMNELNIILAGVFPDAKLHAAADLSEPDKVLVPKYQVEMSSNVRTPVGQQGTGVVRSAVFALLRFRQRWVARREDATPRGLLIGFEEPEIYLHPSAANSMRDSIYELSTGASQIVATTHSPYMIDLSRKPRQVLNRFSAASTGVNVVPFNVTDEYKRLTGDDQHYVKMLLKMDDYISRVFFTKTAVIVEGDTEDIVFRQTLARLPEAQRSAIRRDFEVVRARGKAAIIGLARYLRALGISIHAVHDRDGGIRKAEDFNSHILDAVGDPNCVTVLAESIEDVLGYEAPSKEKPYRAFREMEKWGPDWSDVPENWRTCVERVFQGYI